MTSCLLSDHAEWVALIFDICNICVTIVFSGCYTVSKDREVK
jgi:hypothetical protein